MCKLILLLSISLFINSSQLQAFSPGLEDQLEAECHSKKQNCSQCIQTPQCKWCKDPNVERDKKCFYKALEYTCAKELWEEPKSQEINMSHGPKDSLIRPSNIHVKLRPGASHKLKVSMVYKDEENRPLDLYILMDLSCTMSIHKERVAKLAQELANRLKNLTKDLRMGFGTFVDKPVLPFASEKENHNVICNDVQIKYVKPHLFKNHLNLTSDISKFTKTVNESTILTNVDEPEGGLDALMQAITCKQELKWRYGENTRRLIVLSTDGPFHLAMDGKLGGIILPNDGKCHLDGKDEYDHATILDYPSVSQLKDKIQESSIFVIFAVTNQYKPLYDKLSQSLGSGLTSVSVITEDDSASITKVIEEEYKKVVRTVTLLPVRNSHVDVTYYAKCPGSSDHKKQSGCDNLTPNAKVHYEIELTLKGCPRNSNFSSWRTSVIIQPSTFTSGTANFLNISVDMLCGCVCENTALSPPTSKCHDQGFEQCGICKCLPSFGGPLCNCKISETESVDSEFCLYNATLCSNRGQCICGKCGCDEGYVGTHCECATITECPLDSGDEGHCNADKGQGQCECNGCKCNDGFEGKTCQCPVSKDACRTKNNELCNNFGSCECGKCVCKSGHHGKYCELESAFEFDSNSIHSNSNCKASLKNIVEPCVKCLSFDQATQPVHTRTTHCPAECGTEKNPKIKADVQSKLDQRRSTDCEGKVVDEMECEVQYLISGQDTETGVVYIKTVQTSTCPPPAPILSIILSVVGSILLIGMLTLFVWKVLTSIHDKKEYQKFENERMNATWSTNQNPLYKGTVSEFQNPAYSADIDSNEDDVRDFQS